MQPTVRKVSETKRKPKDKSKEETQTSQKQDDKPNTFSTPRSFVQKTSISDIYTQKKKSTGQSVKAPKKVVGTSNVSKITPMKDLKFSPSTISQLSIKSSKSNMKASDKRLGTNSARPPTGTPKTEIKLARKLPFSNVTVTSPVTTRKHEVPSNRTNEIVNRNEAVARQRNKTRTLKENEIKILTPETVDNNAEMINLNTKLVGKPKTFYVELEGKSEQEKVKDTSPSEEESYEDDFESYESDFESYRSESSNMSSKKSSSDLEVGSTNEQDQLAGGDTQKENKDEEKMLDSGNFDLREAQRSAQRHKPAMDFILEGSEDVEKKSFTDEGFQDMSGSSAISSMKNVNDVTIERPLFIDLQKSKENRRKRRIIERIKQRAKDILSMVMLHEMSYNLFDLKPIRYDLYMATFGRTNHIQTASQTFDDGISEEIQTDDILSESKWTQHPAEFSKHIINLNSDSSKRKNSQSQDDYLTKFTFMINKCVDPKIDNEIKVDENYISNPLRIYLEQQKGVGPTEILPYEEYKRKIDSKDVNSKRLRKFLKRVECKICKILCKNYGDTVRNDLLKSKYNFSKGYLSITPKTISITDLSYIKLTRIVQIIYSETKSNLMLTVSKKISNGYLAGKSVVCLWDIGVVTDEPLKVLIAIDNICVGRFRGNAEGIFVAALDDGSIQLWDLSEEPTWQNDANIRQNPSDLTGINNTGLTEMEKDREWNLKNSRVDYEHADTRRLLQACAFTSSAHSVTQSEVVESVVGLQFMGETQTALTQDARKIVGQVCSLEYCGILTIWNIIQEKFKTMMPDAGKAFWSKMKLEKSQIISLIQYLDVPLSDVPDFNLNAAKRRILNKNKEKNITKKQYTRGISLVGTKAFERPSSAIVKNQGLSVKAAASDWENGVVCNDLRVTNVNNVEHILVAKNHGEVLMCTRRAGQVKLNTFCVTADTSSVTCLEVSPHGLPHFLAGTSTGMVSLCSILESRVLLTLDCRNGPPDRTITEKYQPDNKGRYLGSTETSNHSANKETEEVGKSKWEVSHVSWSARDPCVVSACCAGAGGRVWLLSRGDLHAAAAPPAVLCAAPRQGDTIALLTAEGEVQVHRVDAEQDEIECLQLFQKYVALL